MIHDVQYPQNKRKQKQKNNKKKQSTKKVKQKPETKHPLHSPKGSEREFSNITRGVNP